MTLKASSMAVTLRSFNPFRHYRPLPLVPYTFMLVLLREVRNASQLALQYPIRCNSLRPECGIGWQNTLFVTYVLIFYASRRARTSLVWSALLYAPQLHCIIAGYLPAAVVMAIKCAVYSLLLVAHFARNAAYYLPFLLHPGVFASTFPSTTDILVLTIALSSTYRAFAHRYLRLFAQN